MKFDSVIKDYVISPRRRHDHGRVGPQVAVVVGVPGPEAAILAVVGELAPGAAHAHHLLRGAEAQLGLEGLAAVLAFALEKSDF